ncbi:MAG: DUF1440 domain-containing protein [Candidatus Eisenbacteria bacterium]
MTRAPGYAVARIALVAGALAGMLDLTAALLQAFFRGRPALRVLQSIASGWLGKAAYSAGPASAALGVVSHFAIATVWAALYAWTARRSPQLVRHAWQWGAAYGLIVYAVMYEVVLPLSAIHHRIARSPQDTMVGLAIHVVCVGWPIALVARAHTPRRDIEPE